MTDEYILSNLLATTLGLDVALASRFNDDPKYLYDAAQKQGIEPAFIKEFLNQLNYNARMRETNKKSMLPELEGNLVQMISQINPTMEQLESFGDMLVVDANYMDNPEFYSADKLAQVAEQFKTVCANLEASNVQTQGFSK